MDCEDCHDDDYSNSVCPRSRCGVRRPSRFTGPQSDLVIACARLSAGNAFSSTDGIAGGASVPAPLRLARDWRAHRRYGTRTTRPSGKVQQGDGEGIAIMRSLPVPGLVSLVFVASNERSGTRANRARRSSPTQEGSSRVPYWTAHDRDSKYRRVLAIEPVQGPTVKADDERSAIAPGITSRGDRVSRFGREWVAKTEHRMFRAIALSVVLTLAVGPNVAMLCNVRCHSHRQTAAVSACHHEKPSATSGVIGVHPCADCGNARLSAPQFLREDVQRSVSALDVDHAILVPRYQLARSTSAADSGQEPVRTWWLEKRPLPTALRI